MTSEKWSKMTDEEIMEFAKSIRQSFGRTWFYLMGDDRYHQKEIPDDEIQQLLDKHELRVIQLPSIRRG